MSTPAGQRLRALFWDGPFGTPLFEALAQLRDRDPDAFERVMAGLGAMFESLSTKAVSVARLARALLRVWHDAVGRWTADEPGTPPREPRGAGPAAPISLGELQGLLRDTPAAERRAILGPWWDGLRRRIRRGQPKMSKPPAAPSELPQSAGAEPPDAPPDAPPAAAAAAARLPAEPAKAPGAAPALPAAARDAPAAADAPRDPQAEPVDAAVFCPPVVARATGFLVQVFLYPPQEAEAVRARALEADATAQRRGVLSLPLDLPRGTRIDLRLEMPGLRIDEPDAALVWRGAPSAAQFEVGVPDDAAIGTTTGRIRFWIAGVPAGTLRFQVGVAAAASPEPARAAELTLRRYRRAFVSYSSKDRAEVLRRVQAFRIAGLSVFQDVLELEPGERWERELYREIDGCDVFLLFWSRAAAASAWVAKEIDYALARKQGQDEQPPDIQPVPIEGPPIPAPPDKLRHLHFNDALLAHIAAAQAPPAPP